MKQLQEIIDIIGKQRFIILAALLVITGGLVFTWQQILLPHSEEIDRENKTIESDRARLQAELVELPIRYKTLKENEAKYDELIQSSFISSQDRITARPRIDTIRVESALRGMTYSIAPLEKITDQNTQGLDGQLVRSKISVSMQGLSDVEMRDFVENMQEDFGGLILLRSAEYKLEKPLNAENLKALSNGSLTHFVSGKVALEWYSILPVVANPVPADGGPQQ